MHVAELWRYPVKSMAGERLREVRLTPLGLEGDRVVHVEGARGRVVTARTHPKLLGHHAVLGAQGEPLVDGRAWTDPSVTADIERIVGAGARLVRDDGVGRFDILPLLIATDGAIAAFGYDGRRLRPNLVIGGVRGLDERTWEGKGLRIGDVLIALADLRGRCVMTTFDPDTLAQDHGVLRSIVDRFDGRLALNATVVRAGRVGEGDRVDLVEASVRSTRSHPASRDEEALQTVAVHLDEVQEGLGRPFLIENPSTYVAFRTSTMTKLEFLNEPVHRTGRQLLCDVSNVYPNAYNDHLVRGSILVLLLTRGPGVFSVDYLIERLTVSRRRSRRVQQPDIHRHGAIGTHDGS